MRNIALFVLIALVAIMEVSCATTTAPAATCNTMVATTTEMDSATNADDAGFKEWTGFFVVEQGDNGPNVLIYVGDAMGKRGDWPWVEPTDWIEYSPVLSDSGQYVVNMDGEVSAFFAKITLTRGGIPVVEALLDECRMEVSTVNNTMQGYHICVGYPTHCGNLYKAALVNVRPLVPLEKCEGLIEPAVPE